MTISRIKQVRNSKKNLKQVSSITRLRTCTTNAMILPTTAFLLTALFYTIKSEDQENNSKVLAEFKPSFSCEPKTSPFTTTIPMLPASHHDIAKFIDGSATDCGWVVEFIDSMCRLNPFMKTYFDLVFTDLENFNIKFHSNEESFKKHIDSININDPSTILPAGFFKIDTRTMHLKNSTPTRLMDDVRHEMRHAAMLVVQKILRNSKKSTSTECYFPNTPEEQSKVQIMVNKGLKRAVNLRKILIQEYEGTISKSNQEELNQLRLECREEHQQFYRVNAALNIPETLFKKISSNIGKQIRPGVVINLDQFNREKAGDLQVVSLTKSKNGYNIIASYLDPIACAAHEVSTIEDTVRKNYDNTNDYLSEFDAYLTAKFPQAIIQYLFPELHQYMGNLFNRALIMRDIQNNKINENYVYSVLTTSTEHYQASDAENMITYADYAISKNMINTAKAGLQTLVDKGYQKDEAYLRLARIAYGEENYEKCRLFYKRAEKNKASLDYVDYMRFAKCIEPVEPESAKYYRKKANNLM